MPEVLSPSYQCGVRASGSPMGRDLATRVGFFAPPPPDDLQFGSQINFRDDKTLIRLCGLAVKAVAVGRSASDSASTFVPSKPRRNISPGLPARGLGQFNEIRMLEHCAAALGNFTARPSATIVSLLFGLVTTASITMLPGPVARRRDVVEVSTRRQGKVSSQCPMFWTTAEVVREQNPVGIRRNGAPCPRQPCRALGNPPQS